MKRTIPQDRAAFLAQDAAEGLSETQVAPLRERYGTNAIAEQPPRSLAKLALDAIGDPMIWFLLGTSGLFGLIGQYTDMAVLLGAILPLLGMDFYLHRRTQASIEGLSSVLASEAQVVRNGIERRVAAEALVPGDLVMVSAGETFPADGIVVAGEGLQAEESSLTGEAYPVVKRSHAGSVDPEEEAWCFAGTRLLTGSARMRVIFTGGDTLYGEVVRSVVEGPQGRTPLQHAVAGLVKILLITAAAICIFLAGVRLWQGFGFADALLSAATLAVAAIPEEFPVVLTFFLGSGIYRLAKSRALVRRAVAVENIGRVSAICSDKTGTMTEGRLAFSEAVPGEGVETGWLLTLAGLASRADSGDPLDRAIIERAAPVPDEWTRVAVFPFTEGRRRESALWRRDEASTLLAMKGAPETILALCDIEEFEREQWLQEVRSRSAEGRKMIGCAWRPMDGEPEEEPTRGLRFAGLIGVADRIRTGVREAVHEARAAGIQVVMVTGDHPETAAAIAREAGMGDAPHVVSGDDLESTLAGMSDAQLRDLSVVARASPAQKVLLVDALKRSGRIVAVTGDGVNDAPALRRADIGIAMGLRGTRSAREVSAIVLMDDNFRTIVTAIAEGRQLFRNLRMSFAFLLMIHLPLVATAALIPLFGYPLLYLPVHIVWLELLIHPAAILGFQQGAAGVLRPGSHSKTAFFTGAEWLVIAAVGTGIAVTILTLFIVAVSSGEPTDHARSMALVSLVVSLAVLLLALTRARTRIALFVAGCAVATAAAFTRVDALAALAHMHPLGWGEWLGAAMLGALPALGAVLLGAGARQTPDDQVSVPHPRHAGPVDQ